MRSQIFALGLASVATAAYAPPAYGAEETSSVPAAPAYGESSTSSPVAPAYEATTSTPEAEKPTGYGGSWGSSSSESESAPAYTTPAATTPAGYGGDKTVTDVYSEYTTYCPEATTLTHGGKTYTVSTATTLTITSCYGGCTKESASVPTWAPSSSASVPYSPVETSMSAPAPPVYGGSSSATWATSAATVPYYPTGVANATTPAGTGYPSVSASQPASYTGAASNVAAGAMVGLSGLVAALFM
ncbi:hypothetical protein AC578_5236 [Pseudocercospora eumusae]|uniref:Uncharacterized protein n=1 Tax=Pseudocercospora eumusae TaxID=321146 RepID=A0A139HDL2_9PEZI|nr:hypothetical protein AC578_5236 [Pseudocercospora eumusae]